MYTYSMTLPSGQVISFDEITDTQGQIILICVTKNESRLPEWIDYYITLGFDKIIIGDNNDDPNILPKTLKTYVENGQVDIYNLSGLQAFQYAFYTAFSERGNYKWAAYFDCDEWLRLRNVDTIQSFLENKDGDVIGINWMSMCNDGTINGNEKRPMPRLPLQYTYKNYITKSIVNGDFKCWFKNPHCPMGRKVYLGGGYNRIEQPGDEFVTGMLYYKEAWIEHQTLVSLEDTYNKIRRGYPDGAPTGIANLGNDFAYLSKTYNTFENFPLGWNSSMWAAENEDFKLIGFIFREGYTSIYPLEYFHDFARVTTGRTFLFNNCPDFVFNMILDMNYALGNKHNIIVCETPEEVINRSSYYFDQL